jgi:hypothetical protein
MNSNSGIFKDLCAPLGLVCSPPTYKEKEKEKDMGCISDDIFDVLLDSVTLNKTNNKTRKNKYVKLM